MADQKEDTDTYRMYDFEASITLINSVMFRYSIMLVGRRHLDRRHGRLSLKQTPDVYRAYVVLPGA